MMAAAVLATALLALPMTAAAAGPENAPPVPAEAFFRRPAIGEVQLSPSGRRVAMSAEFQGRNGVFVVDLQAAEIKAQAAAVFNDADVRSFQWVDDERLVFSVVDLQSGLALDQRVAPGLFAVRFDGSELRSLVARFGRPVVTDGSRQRTLPWNHSLLQVPAAVPGVERPGDVIVGAMRVRNRTLMDVTPLWLDTRTGRTQRLDVGEVPADAMAWWFTPQGVPRMVLTRTDDREALHLYHPPRDGQSGRWVRVADAPRYQLPFTPAWIAGDGRVWVTHRAGPGGERVLAPFDVDQGRPGPPLVVVKGFDFSGQVIGAADGSTVAGVRVDGEEEQTVWLDPARKALQQRVDAALPGRVNRVSCRRCNTPDEVVVVRSWSDRLPGQLLLRLPGTAEGQPRWKVIGLQQPGIDPTRMGRVSFTRIRARDGRDLPVWVTTPAGTEPGQPRPAVVLVHGGPWVRIGHWRWEPMAQFLASRGYVVIEPEFRGSSGYGAAHEHAGDKQFGQAMQDDVSDALLWAQAQKIASDKACIAGGSYGGYSTLMGLIRTPELFRCGSAWFAVADLLLYVEGGWFVTDDISDEGRRYFLPERVGDPEKDRAMLLANSPVEQAHRIRAPLQLIWGSDDKRVPINHGTRLRSAMRKAGQEPEWIEYEGEAHGLRKTENRVDMALKLEAFLARHLK